MKLFKEHQYLLMRRECRVVLGRRASNLWLLTIVLAATFFAVAFSAASIAYLKDKMDDPFTNWVNIDLRNTDEENIERLRDLLDTDSVQRHYGFNSVQSEINNSLTLVSASGQSKLFSTLFYENLSNNLIKAVLKEDNVINGCSINPDSLADSSLGVIMTIEALEDLGYSVDNLPAYINYYSKSVGADTLGLKMLDKTHARAPLPLLAVVKRLPMNKEAVASKYLNEVRITAGRDCPIDINHENYARELFYFVPANLAEEFAEESVRRILPSELAERVDEVLSQTQVKKRLQPWKEGAIMRIYVKTGTKREEVNRIEDELTKHFEGRGLERIYNYDNVKVEYKERDNVYSVYFEGLKKIEEFERFVKAASTLQIEMTQVNAKKNFNAVSHMAIVLTVAMLVFSIISIIIFIVNMMQSYFPKVKRNLGTFKAFGLSTNELVRVYVVIIVGIVIMALIMALTIVGLTELFLPLRDNESEYLILWNMWTCSVVALILLSTLVSVIIVLRNLLRSTPGNLIYDR